MAVFTDSEGYRWTNELDYAAIVRVQNQTGVKLLKDPIPELFEKLSDPVVLIDVLWAINRPEAERLGISEEEFGPRCLVDQNPIFVGLMEDLQNFFLRLNRTAAAKTLETIVSKSQELFALVQDQEIADAEIRTIQERFDSLTKTLKEKLRTQKKSSGDSQD